VLVGPGYMLFLFFIFIFTTYCYHYVTVQANCTNRTCYVPHCMQGGSKCCFCQSVCLCPSVAYIANDSRTQRHSVAKCGMKVPHLRCDSHTSFKVKRSKVRVTDGWGHTVSAEPGGHSACIKQRLTLALGIKVNLYLKLSRVGAVEPKSLK